MAPTVKKKSSIPSPATKLSSNSRRPPQSSYDTTYDVFKSSKKDKRTIKHSSLISRIEKNIMKPKRKRRPSKKLVANLESLMDALPEASEKLDDGITAGEARIKHKSLKSKPGALKRKEKLEEMERDRFTKNMAQMVNLGADDTRQAPDDASKELSKNDNETSKKWVALRGFIQQTMDRSLASAN